MVKLYCLSVLYKGATSATWLKSAYDLQSFNFFQKGSVQEFMAFVSKTIVERTQIASRQSVKEGGKKQSPMRSFNKINQSLMHLLLEYMCHVYVRSDGLAGVIISDHEYPSRVSHTLITKVLDEFALKYPLSTWADLNERDTVFPQLNTYLAKYQNPREADTMTKIQDELDETKIILVNHLFNLKE